MGKHPDNMTGSEQVGQGEPSPSQVQAPVGSSRSTAPHKAVLGYAAMMRRRVEASMTLTEADKMEWHCLLDALETGTAVSRLRASKLVGELNRRAPVVDGPRPAPKKSPEELGRDLVQERMKRMANG